MQKRKNRKAPVYALSWEERKVMRAIWLKNAPISYEELIGVCVSDYWKAEYARDCLASLLARGIIEQLPSGRYDSVLEYREYKAYERRWKRNRKREKQIWPFLCADSRPDLGEEPEYVLRTLDKMLEKRRGELEEE